MSFANKKIPLQGKKEYSEINYEFESVNEIILTRGINGKKVIMFEKKKKDDNYINFQVYTINNQHSGTLIANISIT